MHPGRVLVPIAVAPGAEITSRFTWITGPVFRHSVCYHPQQIVITLEAKSIAGAFEATDCGDGKVPATVNQTFFATDPVYQPKPATQP